MSSVSNDNVSAPLIEYWDTLPLRESEQEEPSSSSSLWNASVTSVETVSNGINWFIQNRGGLAFLTGLALVPSQFAGPNAEESLAILNDVCTQDLMGGVFAAMNTVATERGTLRYMIYYPNGKSNHDSSKCVLYHNPNGMTVAQYFDVFTHRLRWTPGDIAELEQCPIILYDYEGTGCNADSEPNSSSLATFKPTYQTVINNGTAMFQVALELFNHVSVWGSSLGGGVATVSTANYLRENQIDRNRITLTNHDSFTSTPKVVFPNGGFIAKALGSFLGGSIDATDAMTQLVAARIGITILCHMEDPVIPRGARMAELFGQFPMENVKVILSPRRGHADLSFDMIEALKGIKA